uniref:Intron-binding protein aquarius n=1 Tax=Cajanus cajan TaxID=3821 RepID=A0A151RTC9_CAJCA|nr:Intron-binding protein aquarius [Cajanus cajan]
MTKVYGTGTYDFRRHRVAEYPVAESKSTVQKTGGGGGGVPSSITLSEIQRDRLTKIAEANWLVSGDVARAKKEKEFDPDLVRKIYESELLVKEGSKPVPLQRVMILEVSQYLENYLWPHFDPLTATFEHVMSIILMVNEKFRENVAAWTCFHERKDAFKGFLERVLRLKEGRELSIAEKTNYLVFMINAFQSLEDDVVSRIVLRLASLKSWHSLSYGRFQMELCLNPGLIKKWKRMMKKEPVKGGGSHSTTVEVMFVRNFIEEFLEILDSQVFTQKQLSVEDDELMVATGLGQVNDACVLYCERFMEFLIDLLSQLPTRRYLRPLVADLRELALSNIGSIHKRANLSKKLSVLSPEELRDLVCCKLKLVSKEDPWSERVDFLIEVMVSYFEKQQSQKEAINALPLYPNEQIMWDESVVPSINYSGEGCLALPKLNLQFLTLHDYLLRNFNLFRLESTYEIREDIQEAVPHLLAYINNNGDTAFRGNLMNDFSGRIKRDEWKPPKGELRTVTVALDTAQYHMDVSNIADKGAEDVYESIRDLMNEYCIVPKWLENIFLGYGDPSAAQWTNMPDLLETVDFKDTFVDADHLKGSFVDYEVSFINPDGTENLNPRPPFKIKLPRTLKPSNGALTGGTTGINTVDANCQKETLIIETYTPPDPGPYPQDQPKQNSVRFTPIQVEAIISGIQPGLTMVVGPPGTGKTDTAVQILNVLYHNCPSQRTLIITHSNQALNDLFEKIMQRDVPARYLLRLGQGEQELATDLDFSRQGRVNSMLVRRLELLSEVERLARSLQLPEDVGYTCETAGYFWLLHVYSRWEQFLAACAENKEKPTFVQDHMRAAMGCFRHLKTMFQELEECRAFELLKSTADRANYLMTKQAKIVAMTCTHAALKRKDFLQLGFKYDNLLMEESAQILEIETFIPMLLQRQEDARPSIAKLYNWRYRDLGDLPSVKEEIIFNRANAGFAYDYQLVDVPDYLGKGETTPSPWFYQNEGEAEYVVSVYIYLRLLGYPANKISILTTYNGQKLLIRDVINRRCIPYDFIGPPSKVTTVDKFQGQQNDFILLSLVRTRFVGHLRDVRRLVVAMSRARLGLYVFCRRSLFEQCYELQPTFQLLLKRPDHLALNMNEITSYTVRDVEDPGPIHHIHLVSGIEEMASIIDSLYQEKLRHQFHQNGPYFSHLEPSENTDEVQNMQQTEDTDMREQTVDTPPESKGTTTVDNHVAGDMPPENSVEDVTMVDNSAGVANGSPTSNEGQV